jgi:hypothetical protein
VKPKLVGYINFNKYLWNRQESLFYSKNNRQHDCCTHKITKSQAGCLFHGY